MMEMTVAAKLDNVPVVTDFLNRELEAAGCPMKQRVQLDIVMDELFSNIARYAYPSGEGMATVHTEIFDEPRRVVLTFEDCGIPYDPLQKKDPDVSLKIEDRAIGGLGIFMVKKTVDNIRYERREGKNILTVEKNF